MLINQELRESEITYQTNINCSKEKLWEVISTPGNLEFCHPFCKENTVTRWGEVGAKDTIQYYNGLKLHRLFTEWNIGKGYKLLIGRGKYATAKVIWEITAKEDRISILSISINIYSDIALKRYSKFLRWVIKEFYLLPNMSNYVKDVVKGFKYYIETGNSVKKNQFGNNRMFSNIKT
jgi:hypothetical protein